MEGMEIRLPDSAEIYDLSFRLENIREKISQAVRRFEEACSATQEEFRRYCAWAEERMMGLQNRMDEVRPEGEEAAQQEGWEQERYWRLAGQLGMVQAEYGELAAEWRDILVNLKNCGALSPNLAFLDAMETVAKKMAEFAGKLDEMEWGYPNG